MLRAKNLTKKFNGFTAVDNISFEVAQGKILAFLGPNGAGKTTTIKMFTTLMDSTEGQLLINGIDPTTDPNGARHSFGIVFQDQSLDEEMTAYENMELHAYLYGVPRKEMRGKIETLLGFVELLDRKNDLVKKFSGGMRRRLEIARGLIHHPKILFLDEPTLGLDPQTRNHIWEYIKKMRDEEQMTVFFSTHYMEEAERVADEIIVIDNGKIIGHGTPDELKKQTGTDNLEDAFLQLTGHSIREQEAGSADNMRMFVNSRVRR